MMNDECYEAETLKTANRPERRSASAVAGLECQGGLAGKALQLRVFAALLFISAPPVPLNPAVLSSLARCSSPEKLILLAPLVGVLLWFKHPPSCGRASQHLRRRVPETT
jgi:hypothetical protein